MKKEYVRYMRLGKRVAVGNEKYILVRDAKAGDTELQAVNESNYRRYDRLRAWSRNHVGVTPEQEAEMNGYIELLPVANCTPDNDVQIMDGNWDERFRVKDLTEILFNGEKRTVNWLDDCHFDFVGHPTIYGCFHIYQFGELTERRGWQVEPAEKEESITHD